MDGLRITAFCSMDRAPTAARAADIVVAEVQERHSNNGRISQVKLSATTDGRYWFDVTFEPQGTDA